MHLQADVLAGAERAADAAEHEPHLLVGQAEAGGDLLAVLVQPLGGDVQLDAGAAGVGHRQRRLQPEERLVLHADLVRALDDDVADDATGRRSTMRWWRMHVAVGVDRRMAAVDRRLGIESAASSTSYVDDDRGQRPPAGLGMVGGDGGDRLADVAHDVAGEHRLVLLISPYVSWPGTSSAVMTASTPAIFHAGDDVDAHDPGVRVRRAQRGAPQARRRPPRSDGERERALHLGDAVGPRR